MSLVVIRVQSIWFGLGRVRSRAMNIHVKGELKKRKLHYLELGRVRDVVDIHAKRELNGKKL
jgi:hypothetical protein